MHLKDATGSFFVEFSRFEHQSVGMALRSLSKDPIFVEHAEQLLDLEARLKLLERLAFSRGVPPVLMAELEGCLVRARILCGHREEVARNLSQHDLDSSGSGVRAVKLTKTTRRRVADFSRLAELKDLWVPAVERVREYADEAVELQETLRLIALKLEAQPTAAAAGTG